MSRVSRRDYLHYLKYAGIGIAIAGGAYFGKHYFERPETIVTPSPTKTTIQKTITQTISATVTEAETLRDYLLSHGVSEPIANMTESYGDLDENKKVLGDCIIKIQEIEPSIRRITYQKRLIDIMKSYDPYDVSKQQLNALNRIFRDKELAINMLEFCMYDKVFDYFDILDSLKYEDNPKLIYATLEIPLFKKVDDKSKNYFKVIMEKGSDQKYKKSFEKMFSEGNIDKSIYPPDIRGKFTSFCTPLESYIWIYEEDDSRADKLLKDYDMKRMVSEGFRSDTSGNYASNEWINYDDAANRLGWHEWINWKWVKDNLIYDKTLPPAFVPPESTYKKKKGVCGHAALFTAYNLERGAYVVTLIAINYIVANKEWLHGITVEEKRDGLWNVMNFGYSGPYPITGPFANYEEVVKDTVKKFGGRLKGFSILGEYNYEIKKSSK
ncbi:MAG: hypothetical protein QW176_01405 [Candidatus Bathyarchaeia archaeon]